MQKMNIYVLINHIQQMSNSERLKIINLSAKKFYLRQLLNASHGRYEIGVGGGCGR